MGSLLFRVYSSLNVSLAHTFSRRARVPTAVHLTSFSAKSENHKLIIGLAAACLAGIMAVCLLQLWKRKHTLRESLISCE